MSRFPTHVCTAGLTRCVRCGMYAYPSEVDLDGCCWGCLLERLAFAVRAVATCPGGCGRLWGDVPDGHNVIAHQGRAMCRGAAEPITDERWAWLTGGTPVAR